MCYCQVIKVYSVHFVRSMYFIKVKFTLQQATKTQRGSRGTALLFL